MTRVRPVWRAASAPWLRAALAGVSATLAWAVWSKLDSQVQVGELLALAVVVGMPIGAMALLLGGVLLRTGGWLLGGQASAGQVRTALGWAVLPVVAGLPLWLLPLLADPVASSLLVKAGVTIQAMLWCWAVVRSMLRLAVVHRITLMRAMLSWLLAALVAVGAFGALLGGAALIISLRGG